MSSYKGHILSCKQLGVGLIEILLAWVVITTGLLAVATGQKFSLRVSQDAYLHTQVNVLMFALVDCVNMGQHLNLSINSDQLISHCEQLISTVALNKGDIQLTKYNDAVRIRLDWSDSLGQPQSIIITSIL